MMKYFIIILLLCLSHESAAQAWRVDYSKSFIKFSGKYVGEEFQGNFSNWQAEINFDKSSLEKSNIIVKIDLLSAVTNNPSYTKTLAESDWFDSKKEQFANFTSTTIQKKDDDLFLLKGFLEIKGLKKSLEFDSQIKLQDKQAEASADFTVDRTYLDIGKISDNSGSWVDKEVKIVLKIVAAKD